MKAVVDTNVIAYGLLGNPQHAPEAMTFLQSADELLAPSLWEAELANVIWMAARTGAISSEEAPAKLALAARLGIHSIANRTLWHGALLRSLQSGVAVYDTLFVELAAREDVSLATFDQKLAKVYPAIARRPAACAP